MFCQINTFCLVTILACLGLTTCQEYLVPVYVKADAYGTAHFKLPEPKTGPPKSSFHIEQLIKLESELIGLGDVILQTEQKLHAKKKVKDESKDKTSDKKKDDPTTHKHNYTREMNFIDATSKLNDLAFKDIKKYIANPLAMFPIRKRLAETWPYVMDNITECSMVAEYAAINDHFQNVNRRLQQDGDLELAYQDLLRLQKAYNLPVSSLARGWIMDEVTDPLSLKDIIAIANICLDREDLEGTLDWLLQVAKFLKSLGLQGAEKNKYMNILGGAYLRLNRLQEAKLVYGQLLKEDPKNRIALSNMQLITEKIKEEDKKEQKAKENAEKDAKKKTKTNKFGKSKSDKDDKKETEYKEEWWMKYCRGDFDPDWEKEALLKCYVKHIPISGLRYNIEPLSIDPPIYLIKDVLHNFTMSKLVDVASKELSQRIHSFSQGDEPSVPIYGSEENFWMEKLAFTMRNLTYQKYRVDSHSDYNLLAAVRVYNVGAGGTSNPGKGELRVNPHQGWEKNFIARYMMFLTTPKAGGHFAFPWAKVRVTPERGDVLFWQFRTPWGYVHPQAYHWLECPVVLGDFWYAEQMIEHHNMIDKVDFMFNPNQFFIPESLKKPKSKKVVKKVVKKSKATKKEIEEEEEEEAEPVEEEVAEEEIPVEEVVEEAEEEEQEVEEEEEKPKPVKKVIKKVVKKEVKEDKKLTKEVPKKATKDSDKKMTKETTTKKEEVKAEKKKEEKEDTEEETKPTPTKKKIIKKTIKKKKVVKK